MNWIPADRQIPKDGQSCLVWIKDGTEPHHAWYSKFREEFCRKIYEFNSDPIILPLKFYKNVTHWAAMPSSPVCSCVSDETCELCCEEKGIEWPEEETEECSHTDTQTTYDTRLGRRITKCLKCDFSF